MEGFEQNFVFRDPLAAQINQIPSKENINHQDKKSSISSQSEVSMITSKTTATNLTFQQQFGKQFNPNEMATGIFQPNNFLNNQEQKFAKWSKQVNGIQQPIIEEPVVNNEQPSNYKPSYQPKASITNFQPQTLPQQVDQSQIVQSTWKQQSSQVPMTNYNMMQGDLIQEEFFTDEVMFLLSEEDNNISGYREIIENEKQRLNNDFDFFLKEITNLLEETKNKIQEHLDDHYKMYINRYKEFKQEVLNFKNVKLEYASSQQPLELNEVDFSKVSNANLIKELQEIKSKKLNSQKLVQLVLAKQKEHQQKVSMLEKQIISQQSSSQSYYNSANLVKSFKDLKIIIGECMDVKLRSIDHIIRPTINILEQRQIENPPQQSSFNPVQMTTQQQHHPETNFIQQQEQSQQQTVSNFQQKIKNFASPFELPHKENHLIVDAHDQIANIQSKFSWIETSLAYQFEVEGTPLCIYCLSGGYLAVGTDRSELLIYQNSQDSVWNLVIRQQICEGSITTLNEVFGLVCCGCDHPDCILSFFDYRQGIIVQEVKGHDAAVTGVGQVGIEQIVSAGYDRKVIVWGIDSGQVVRRNQQVVNRSSISKIATSEGSVVTMGLDGEIVAMRLIQDELQVQWKLELSDMGTNIIQLNNDQIIVSLKNGRIIIIEGGQITKEIPVADQSAPDFVILKNQNDKSMIVLAPIQASDYFSAIKIQNNNIEVKRLNATKKINIKFDCGVGPKFQLYCPSQEEIFLLGLQHTKSQAFINVWKIAFNQGTY